MTTSTALIALIGFALWIVVGCVVLQQGIRGRLSLGVPRCRGCGYRLGSHTDPAGACSECGVQLAERGAVRFDKKSRSPLIITLGVLTIILGIVFPIIVELGFRLLSPSPGMRIGAPSATASTKPTWLRPVSETPQKPTHYRMEIGGVSNQELIDAANIRPTDEGLWDALAFRAELDNLEHEDQRRLLDLIIAQYEGPAHVEGNHRLPPRWSSWFWDDEDTRALMQKMLRTLDPGSAEDRAVLERLIAAVGRPDSPLTLEANEKQRVSLFHLQNLLDMGGIRIDGLTCSVDSEVTLEIDRLASVPNGIRLPVIRAERVGEDLVFEMDLDLEIRTPAGDEENVWELRPRMQAPIELVAPGHSAITYKEPDTLPAYYQKAFENTSAQAWVPANDPEQRIIAFTLESPIGDGEAGMLMMNVIPSLENARFLRHVSWNMIGFSFTDSSISTWGQPDQLFEIEAPFDDDTVSVTLEPIIDNTPRDDRVREMGLLGVRVHIEEIPIRWMDRAGSSHPAGTPKVRIERIGHEAEAPDARAASPLVGPVPLTSPEALGPSDRLRTWLDPSLRRWTDDKKRPRISLHYGSETPLSQNAHLRMHISKPDGGSAYYNLLLTQETTTDEDGASRINVLNGFENLLGSQPELDHVRIEFTGFPVTMRRDLRSKEAPWFGGSFMIDVPLKDDAPRANARGGTD